MANQERPSQLQHHLQQLKAIAQLRGLQDEVYKQIKGTMSESQYDVKKDPAYKEGRQAGIEEGKSETMRMNIERLSLKKLPTEDQIADVFDVPLSLTASVKATLFKSGKLKD